MSRKSSADKHISVFEKYCRPLSTSSASSRTEETNDREVLQAANEVAWQDDQDNPFNWPRQRKYTMTILLSALSFNTLLCSTMVAPALTSIQISLNITSEARTQLVLSIFVLAYAVGYFFWAPLSEVYGRKTILQLSNLVFCVFNLVCGFSPNERTLVVGRLLSGAGAAASLALGIGILGEIWQAKERGRSLAVLSTLTLLGPCIGPVLGGAIAQASVSSWRWAFWATTIFNVFLQTISIVVFYESHAPTIIRHRRKQLQTPSITVARVSIRTTLKVLNTNLQRPLWLIFTQPASQGLVLYTGLAFGGLYLALAVIPTAFTEVYHQSISTASLHYFAFGLGITLGAQTCAPIIDTLYRNRARLMAEKASSSNEPAFEVRASKETVPAELRLYPFIPAILLVSCGFLIFGWSLQYYRHWVIADLGIVIFGMGNQSMTQCTNAYVIDTFSQLKPAPAITAETVGNATDKRHPQSININWSASAMASIWAAKSLGGFTFPLFALDMISRLGWGWSCTLIAILNIVVGLPVAISLLVYGAKLRAKGQQRIDDKLSIVQA